MGAGIATGYRLDGRCSSTGGDRIFLFPTASRPALGPTQPPIQWIQVAPYPGLKRPGREADHSPPANAMVKNGGAIPPLLRTSSCRST
jgi:hypothetical protein